MNGSVADIHPCSALRNLAGSLDSAAFPAAGTCARPDGMCAADSIHSEGRRGDLVVSFAGESYDDADDAEIPAAFAQPCAAVVRQPDSLDIAPVDLVGRVAPAAIVELPTAGAGDDDDATLFEPQKDGE